MKNNIEISVIMSEYNTPEADLKEAILSILNQSYKRFEFIIVDDCGRNDVGRITATFNDDRIKIIKNSKNMGLVYSLNNGIKHAKGKYIVRMDTDDIALPGRIEATFNFIAAHPEYDVVGAQAIEFSESTENGILGKSGEKTNKSIMRRDGIIHPTVIMRKSVVENVGYYKDFNRAEDLALWCELLQHGSRLYVMDKVVLKYRVNPADYQKRRLKNRKGEIQARLHFYPKIGANALDYVYILQSIISGLLPIGIVQKYRKKYILRNGE
jgi:glycosyltransferase EpsE